MSDDSGTGGGQGDTSGAEQRGPTEIPEDSPSSESEMALSEQVAQRETDEDQDGR